MQFWRGVFVLKTREINQVSLGTSDRRHNKGFFFGHLIKQAINIF